MATLSDDQETALSLHYGVPLEDVKAATSDCSLSNPEAESDVIANARRIIWQRVVSANPLRRYLKSYAFEDRLSQFLQDLDWSDALFKHITDALARELTEQPHPLAELKNFKSEDRWWAYLYAACRNTIRRERNLRGQPIPPEPQMPESRPSPLQVLIDIEEEKRLNDAIENLPDRRMQEMIRLYASGETMSEIASRLHVSCGTVSRSISRAIDQLRATVSPKHAGEDQE